MILIVSSADDMHTLCVGQELARRGAPYAVVDAARLTREHRLSFAVGAGSNKTWTAIDGRTVDLDAVQVVWHRRRYKPHLPVLPDAQDMDFLGREWDEMFAGVFATMQCPVVNPPAAQRDAVKPLQLDIARQLGLRFPDTLITNDAAAARQFVQKHGGRVVHKTLSPPRHRWLGTMRWCDDDAALLDELVLSPLIFQEMVTDCRELRVTLIGDDIFAAEFRPRNGVVDGRLAALSDYRPHRLPPAIGAQLKRLATRLGLVVCTIDMKLTEDGEYVFLELNPQGQFLYVEILTGMPLCRSMANLLARLAGHATVHPRGEAVVADDAAGAPPMSCCACSPRLDH